MSAPPPPSPPLTSGPPSLKIIRWLLDTRPLWPTGIPEPLLTTLLKPEEQSSVKRYVHLADRKLSFGSYLLKYHAISTLYGISWKDVVLGRGLNRKPCYPPLSPSDAPGQKPSAERPEEREGIEFNVSHQAGLVALIACYGPGAVPMGIDVVCTNERTSRITDDSFGDWVSAYEDVFSTREMNELKLPVPAAPPGWDPIALGLGPEPRGGWALEVKLRRFFAHWGLKEAYIKMTGEALMADWLKELEFLDVDTPRWNPDWGKQRDSPWAVWGQDSDEVTVYLRGKETRDVYVSAIAFERDYMIAIAFERPRDNRRYRIEDFEILDLERDILMPAT